LLLRALFRRKATWPKWILIDGSHVLYWRAGTPQLNTLRQVIGHLAARGSAASVVSDANAGHLVSGKNQHHGAMGALLRLPEDRVMARS